MLLGGTTDATKIQEGESIIASAELYDPSTLSFTPTGSAATPRRIHTATALQNGTVLVTKDFPWPGAQEELYDPSAGVFNSTAQVAFVIAAASRRLAGADLAHATGSPSVPERTSRREVVRMHRLGDPRGCTPSGGMAIGSPGSSLSSPPSVSCVRLGALASLAPHPLALFKFWDLKISPASPAVAPALPELAVLRLRLGRPSRGSDPQRVHDASWCTSA